MTPKVKPLVAGNWKMNGTGDALGELSAMSDGFDDELQALADMLVCVSATLLDRASQTLSGSAVATGGQDCHFNGSGAHTGDISTGQLLDAGASAVIVGHSERRIDHGETDALIRAKAEAGLSAAMQTIICIGETEEERKSGKTLDVLKIQLDESVPDNWVNTSGGAELVIAYEPVWAIGSGLTPTAEDVAEAHQFMRDTLVGRFGDAAKTVRLLYGGSVKPGNAEELMAIANVDGALVGGASLKAADFLGICNAYRQIS